MAEQTAAPAVEEAPAKAKDMHLPPMHRISNDLLAPTAPQDVATPASTKTPWATW